MSYLNVDDGIMEHPKIAPLTAHAKLLHFAGMIYCARNLTDGLIEGKAVKTVAIQADAQRRHLAELAAAGVWVQTESGYKIHDYLDHNPSAEKVKADREAARKRMQRLRSGDVRPNEQRTFAGTSEERAPNVHDPLLSSHSLSNNVTSLLEARPQGSPLDQLYGLATTDEDRAKITRASRGLPESDLVNALEAARGRVDNRLAAALARLKQRRTERTAAA